MTTPTTTGGDRGHHLMNLWFVVFAALLVSWIMLTEPLSRMALNLRPVAFALVFVVGFCGLGAPLVRFAAQSLEVVDQILFSLAAGIGITGLVVFFAGLAGVVSPALYALMTLVGLFMFVFAAARWWRFTSPGIDFTDPLTVLATLVIAPNILLLMPYVASPVCSTDALEYHLMIPKIHLLNGQIGHIPSLLESNYPCLAQFVFMPVLALAGDVACKALHCWIGIAALIALARVGARIAPTGNRLLAPALFLSMPVAACVFGLAYNDAFFVFFVLLALMPLLDYHAAEEKHPLSMILASIAMGLAVWTKYTVVLYLLALAPIFILGLVRWRWKLRHAVAFAVPVGTISLLVFVKNALFTGNPFFPFLHNVFPSPYWTDAAAVYFANAVSSWEIPNWTLATYLSFPFHIVLHPRLIDTQTGIIPLLIVPFLFVPMPNQPARLLKFFILFTTGAWLILHTENRSLLTLFAVIICTGVAGIEASLWQRPTLRRSLVVMICLASIANLGVTAVNTNYMTESLRYFFGLESRQEFLLREAPSQPTFDWLDNTDEVRSVLLVGLKRPFHLDRPAYFSAFADPPIAEVVTRGATSAEEVRDRLAALEISHVVVNTREYEEDHELRLYSWPTEQRRAFEEFIDECGEPVYVAGSDVTYRVGR